MTTKELLALVGKATPGPWVAENGSIVNRECDLDADSNRMHLDLSWDIGEAYHPDNLALIVAAVNALPALCAEVEALRKDAERYRWLREQPGSTWRRIGFNTWNDDPSVFPWRDDEIDAAKEADK